MTGTLFYYRGRRQRNRIAICLLAIALPLELRQWQSSVTQIVVLNEAIRRLGWWEYGKSIWIPMNTTRHIPRNPEGMAGSPQGVGELRLGVSVFVTILKWARCEYIGCGYV